LPSPNMPTVQTAIVYPGQCLLEGTNLSEGRGTAFPFQLIGAGWLNDAGAIARELNRRRIPGVVFDSTIVTVEAGQKWGGQRIPMIAIAVSDRTEVRPYRIGLELLREIYQRHKGEFQWRINSIDRLSGSTRFREAVELGLLESLIPELQGESLRFQEQTAPYLLYTRR